MPLRALLGAGILQLGILLFVCTAESISADGSAPLNDSASRVAEQGDADKALEQLQSAYSLFPYDMALRNSLAEAYAIVGQRRMATGRFDEAETSFANAYKLRPEVQKYSIMRGIALYLAKQHDAAIVELERARADGGDTMEILFFLGRSHYDTGNLAAAIQAWDKALELTPGKKEILVLAAKARRELAVEGKMNRGYSSRFVISHETGERSQLADQVLDLLETSYNQVGSDLSHFPSVRIPVILYTATDYRSVTNSPDWSGGLYDGKIRLPVGGAFEVTPLLRSILFHEYAHVVVHDLTSGNCPAWLNEGIAELEGHRDLSHPLTELAKSVKEGTLLPLVVLERPFAELSDDNVLLAYQQSHSLVKYLVSTYGWHKLKDILTALGVGKMGAEAVTTSLADFGVDYSAFYQEWLQSVQKEYGR